MGVSRQVMGRRTGIVLPVVLGTLIVVVMLVGAIAHLARASYADGLVGAERMRTEWVLQAGLNRAVRALVTPGDVLREDLFGRHLASWAFDGEPLALRMEVESEKVDANNTTSGRSGRDVVFRFAEVPRSRGTSAKDVSGVPKEPDGKRIRGIRSCSLTGWTA